MIRLKKSTASQEVPLGPFVDATDGFTLEDGLGPIAASDIKLWKNGMAAGSIANASSTAAFGVDGTYVVTLDATDTNTVGPLVIIASPAGARPIRVECEVLEAALYDSLFGTVGIAANVKAVDDSTSAANSLELLMRTLVFGASNANSTTTVIEVLGGGLVPAVSDSVADQLKGSVLMFNDQVQTHLRGVTRRIVANRIEGVSPNMTITVEPPLPVAPGNGEVFLIYGGPTAPLKMIGTTPYVASHVSAIANSETSAQRLERFCAGISSGVCGGGGSTVSVVAAIIDSFSTAANAYKGKYVVFANDTPTVALRGQAARITASTYDGVIGGTLTVDALTTAPAGGGSPDLFVILGGGQLSAHQTADAAARLPAALTGGGHIKASVEAVKESTQAASHLKLTQLAVASGSLGNGCTTLVLQLASITPAPTVVDQLRGRVILFVDDASSQADMKIQGGRIVASTTTSVTIEQPLTSEPNSGNVFVIV